MFLVSLQLQSSLSVLCYSQDFVCFTTWSTSSIWLLSITLPLLPFYYYLFLFIIILFVTFSSSFSFLLQLMFLFLAICSFFAFVLPRLSPLCYNIFLFRFLLLFFYYYLFLFLLSVDSPLGHGPHLGPAWESRHSTPG